MNLYHLTQSHKNVELLFYYVLVDMSPLDTSTTVSNEIKVTSAGLWRGTPGNRLEGGDREVRKTAWGTEAQQVTEATPKGGKADSMLWLWYNQDPQHPNLIKILTGIRYTL